MKIKDLKKNLVRLSLVLIIVGVVISTIGFGIVGFNSEKLKEKNKRGWYQTIHVKDDGFWYGIDFGNDFHVFTLGNPE